VPYRLIIYFLASLELQSSNPITLIFANTQSSSFKHLKAAIT